MRPEEFKVGVKFKYIGELNDKENGIENEVLKVDGTTICNKMFGPFDKSSGYAEYCVIISEPPTEKLYTASEVEKIREAAFEAGYKASRRQAGEAMYMEYEYKDYSESNPLK